MVHGGGKRLSEWLGRLGVESRWDAGLRVTDDAALEVAVAVLRGLVNAELVASLRALGADAVGLSGVDGGLLAGTRVAALGRVVAVTTVRRHVLDALLASGTLPVVAPLALDETGAIGNVNADDAAAALAGGLGARTVVLLTDVPGVRGDDGRVRAGLGAAEAESWIASGIVAGGMVPKVRAALRAVASGAEEAVIADGGAERAVERSLEDRAFGTRIRPA